MMRLLLATLLITCCTMQAQDLSKVHFVRASGEAVVTATPDRAQLSVAVTTLAPTAQASSSQNATETAQVIEALKRAIGRNGEVKTTGYSVAPHYEYPAGHPAKLTGYETANTVLVTTDDIASVGTIIDAATGAGANTINSISFTLKDDSEVRAKALSEATLRAKANAEAIARALNVHTAGVLQAEPSEPPVVHPLTMPLMKSAAYAQQAATPIETGTLDVRATVTVTLAVE